MFKELDVVALAHDIRPDPAKDMPAAGMKAGETGTIVFVLGDNEAFMVEFVRRDGYTTALLTLEANDIRPLQRAELEQLRVSA